MRISLTAVLAAGSILTAATLPALAQTPFVLDEVVFSPNRFPTARENVGSAVSVIGREEIETSGTGQLADVLGRQPGVSMTRQGSLGSVTNLRIRGATPRYTAVFVDGIRVDDPANTPVEFDFGAFLSADVGRVEVLRGSQSALWGGSAVAGVVNITTLAAEEDGTTQTAAVEVGRYRTLTARYGLTQRSDRGVLAFNLAHLRSDGFSAADENDGNTDPDGIRSTRASVSLRHAVTDDVILGFAGFVQRTRSDFDGFATGPVDADNSLSRREAGARVFAEFALGDSQQEIGLAYYRIAREFEIPRGNPGFAPTGTRLRLDWLGSSAVSPEFTLVYGADASRERVQRANQSDPTTDLVGGFVQGLWAPRADLDVSVSGRVDRNSDFGTFNSGRASVAWRPVDGLTLRGAVARGFRAPAVEERFSSFAAPAPDLQPETSTSAEIGADYVFAGGARVSGTLFRLDIEDSIRFLFGSPSLYFNDIGRSRREGLELEVAVPVTARMTLGGAYTYLDARNPAGGRLGRIPRHELALSLDARITDRLSNVTTLSARRDSFDFDNGMNPMPGFGVVNTRFAYALDDRTEVSLRIENLFDKQYQLIDGYGTSDRALHVGLASRF